MYDGTFTILERRVYSLILIHREEIFRRYFGVLKAGLRLPREQREERRYPCGRIRLQETDKHAVPRWSVEAGQRKTAAAGLQVGTAR